MTSYYKALCAELVELDQAEPGDYAEWKQRWIAAIKRARTALAAEPPADGEVAELVRKLHDVATENPPPWGRWIHRAAELLERLAVPEPVELTDHQIIEAASSAGLCYPKCWELGDGDNPLQMGHLRAFVSIILTRHGCDTPSFNSPNP